VVVRQRQAGGVPAVAYVLDARRWGGSPHAAEANLRAGA
jgi:hypothetical protein